MSDLRFDPSKAVTFDLAHGLVHLEGAPSRVLVPADALLSLARSAGPEAAAAFGRSLGEAMGRRLAARVTAAAASVDVVVEHLAGEMALAGLGALTLERWGRALVIVIEASPLGAEGDVILESAIAAVLKECTGRPVHALRIGRDGARARFFVGGSASVDKLRAWLSEGTSWGDALVRLHAPAESASAAQRGEA